MTFLRFILGFALALMLIYFLMENAHVRMAFSIFGTKYEDVPLWVVIFFSFVLGFASASLIALLEVGRIRFYLFRAERRIKDMEKELDELRRFVLEEEEGS